VFRVLDGGGGDVSLNSVDGLYLSLRDALMTNATLKLGSLSDIVIDLRNGLMNEVRVTRQRKTIRGDERFLRSRYLTTREDFSTYLGGQQRG